MGERLQYTVDEEFAGERVDRFLAMQMDAGLTRTRAQGLIKEGFVTVDGRVVRPSAVLSAGATVEARVPPPESREEEVIPEDIPLDIVYEDSRLMVVNKPRGMVVHPAPGHPSGTLVNALLAHSPTWSEVGGIMRPGIVHRLDRDTTGLMVVAKDDDAHRALANQLRTRTMKRLYLALVHGVPPTREGIIDAPIGRHPTRRRQMAVVPAGGRSALTLFNVKEVFRDVPGAGDLSLLEVELHSGRTHQIRVHMDYIRHPIVSDPVYGRRRTAGGLKGQALHAYKLRLVHPETGDSVGFEAPLPEDFQQLMDRVREEGTADRPLPGM